MNFHIVVRGYDKEGVCVAEVERAIPARIFPPVALAQAFLKDELQITVLCRPDVVRLNYDITIGRH